MFRIKKGLRLVSAADLKLSLPAAPVTVGSGRWGEAGQWAAGRAQLLPRPGAVPALGASLLRQSSSPALGAQRRRHVFRGQRERSAAPGGAAQAGGRCGEDQGLSGGCRASTVLHAERLQGCPAGRSSSREQPLPGAQILCVTLKTGKKFAEECLQVQSDEWLPPSLKKTFFFNQITFRYCRPFL